MIEIKIALINMIFKFKIHENTNVELKIKPAAVFTPYDSHLILLEKKIDHRGSFPTITK